MGNSDKKFFMHDVQVGKKGQIVIPKNIRDLFNISPDDHLTMLANKQHGIGLLKPDQAREMAENFMGLTGFGVQGNKKNAKKKKK